MNNQSYILVSDTAKTFTQLNEYQTKFHQFKGEYSLLHNQYAEDSHFLSRFLLVHATHPLVVLSNEHERYSDVLTHYHRFLEDDIPKYIEEKEFKQMELKQSLEMDRSLGQLQLSIVKKMIEKQLEGIQSQSGTSPSEHQVLLGKELSLQWTLHMIEDIVEKGNK